MESSVILSYITSTQLGQRTLNGIINWYNCTKNMYHLVLNTFLMARNVQYFKTLFMVFMSCVRLNNTADHLATSTGFTLKDDEYISLLLSAATYDAKCMPQKTYRQLFYHATKD